MQVIKSHRIIYVDVDDTLVIWDWQAISKDITGLVEIKNPDNDVTEYVLPHHRHIELVKQFKVRGHTIVVWSQGGWRWAESVVKALGMEKLVDYVMDKPNWYIDDLPSSAYMTNRIYLDPMNPTKDERGWALEEEDSED